MRYPPSKLPNRVLEKMRTRVGLIELPSFSRDEVTRVFER